ncbi:polysaccharide biosynthesis C-terminal domain-containing protein [Rahnella perminowiae]|uniref:polysaccharide biosynthesis C-terminal domain-containing protein n=1 Tax=Rahnella perminowiae TaxID=2816244 RepID=UPI00215CF1B4|nr:polysaccharide biosynthesis C-terminal domain-containing protein [Rahnella perminowiae]MCR9000078.1 polysaccharide biosynthesis C-terminal domain-containing protein [Rahnella perminowiae]
MQIVSAVGFVTSIGYYNHSVMFARDKPEWQARLTLVYAISNVIAFYIFVRFGLIATALVFSIRTILLYPISAWCALTLLNLTFKQYIKEIFVPIICSGVMCLLLIGMQELTYLNESWVGIVVKVFSGAFFYFILIFTFSSKSKKMMILSLARKIIKRN